jgi:peptidoglycan L-alanyl-D-glutamate endopeptidase CwlK
MQTFDPRTETNIATLCPKAQAAARLFMAAALPAMAAHGVVVKIICGSRTYKEQDALYAKGRSAPGPKVTNAPGGYSNHNFSIAWDIGLFKGTSYLEESPLYLECARIGASQGLDCGAFWKSFQDEPHYQLKTGLSMQQMRDRIAKGLPPA